MAVGNAPAAQLKTVSPQYGMDGSEMEATMNRRKIIAVFVYAIVSWILYRQAWVIGYIPAIWRVPFYYEISVFLVFVVISFIYFKKFNYTTPLQTAAIFVGIVMVADFFAVALLNIKNLGIYLSLPRTWFRFALIFGSTYLTGFLTTRSSDSMAHSDSKTHKAASAASVAGGAITSALGSGVLGFFILAWVWGWYESAVLGAFIGFWVGLVVGIGWSVNLRSKSYSSQKVIMYSLLMALLISGLFVVVSTLIIDGLPE